MGYLFSELVIVRVLQVNALVQAMPRALWMTSLQENCGVSPHYNGFAGVKGGGRYDFQPPQIRQSIRPRGPLYLRRLQALEPAEARRIAERLEIHYTPKHGSWLNMAVG